MERISSRQNPLVKLFREAADRAPGLMLLDGAHLVEEAIASGIGVEAVAMRDDLADGAREALVRDAARLGARVAVVTGSVLSAISPVRQPSGIVAIARRPATTLADALEGSPQLVLVLSGIQDPGNVGAIIRSADAAGVTGIITTGGTADPFGPKALRGSMGSAFRVPLASGQQLDGAAHAARARGLRVLAAVPRGGTPLPRCDLRAPAAVLLGGEGAGLPAEVLALADEQLSIPMRPPVESLNVSIAAALVAYEAQRQREGARA
jgi:TrmH family RNA methyltransferase